MARKFGKKKEISINPIDYNIGLAGLSGVGKTTLIKNVCEKLVGEDGYLMLDIGRESGHDCIDGIISETIPDWEKFEDVVDDIIDNRMTDWRELKVVVIDTLDELFNLSDEEAIRKHNSNNPDKRVDSINSVAGGFGKGLDASIELVLNKIWSLKEVGVSFIVIMHTKTKDIEDPLTGQTYQVITANMPQRYFNAIKTKLDLLGVAYIDREIISEKLGRKDVVTKKELTRNVVASESRKIAFRSDDYNLDSKCRFPQIVPVINLDADEFINAIQSAIKMEQSKSGKPFEDVAIQQQIAKEKLINQVVSDRETKKNLSAMKSEITNYVKSNKGNLNILKPFLDSTKELGYSNPTVVDNLDDAQKIIDLIPKE